MTIDSERFEVSKARGFTYVLALCDKYTNHISNARDQPYCTRNISVSSLDIYADRARSVSRNDFDQPRFARGMAQHRELIPERHGNNLIHVGENLLVLVFSRYSPPSKCLEFHLLIPFERMLQEQIPGDAGWCADFQAVSNDRLGSETINGIVLHLFPDATQSKIGYPSIYLSSLDSQDDRAAFWSVFSVSIST